MRLVRRAEFGWPPTDAQPARPRSGLVIHYDGATQGLASKPHSVCVAYWKRTRAFHMGPSRGWADIGYSFGACPHGYVFEGRGLDREQAAQPGGNATWYSVTLMSGPNEYPTPEQINAVRQLRAWLMGKGVAGAVRGHRDFFATSCPGDLLYRMVRDGTFTKPPNQKDDDMPLTDTDLKKIATAVYDRLTHTVPKGVWAEREGILAEGQRIDPRTAMRQTWAYNKDTYHRIRSLEAKLDAQHATIKELLVSVMAQRGDGPVNVDALMSRIEAAIERVTIRLTIPTDDSDSDTD